MTKKTTLVNENVIRRWGKLANMPALTENFIDTLEEEEMEDEMDAAEDEMAAGEAEMEAGEEAEASVEEKEAVERIVSAVVDAIADETGVDIEVEDAGDDEAAMDDMDAGMDASDELDDMADDEMDAAMRDRAMNRDDEGLHERSKAPAKRDRNKYGGNKGDIKDADRKKKGHHGKGPKTKETAKEEGELDETLELDVIDDEALTEAVLKRVVERLLKRQ